MTAREILSESRSSLRTSFCHRNGSDVSGGDIHQSRNGHNKSLHLQQFSSSLPNSTHHLRHFITILNGNWIFATLYLFWAIYVVLQISLIFLSIYNFPTSMKLEWECIWHLTLKILSFEDNWVDWTAVAIVNYQGSHSPIWDPSLDSKQQCQVWTQD